MFKDDMDEIKRILKEGFLRNNGKYILLAVTALFLFLYDQNRKESRRSCSRWKSLDVRITSCPGKRLIKIPKEGRPIGLECHVKKLKKQVWL